MESFSAQRRRKKEGKHVISGQQRWSALEDAKLCEQIAAIHHGSFPNWKKIAKKLPGRSRNSCRYRWEKLSRGQEISFRPPGFLPMWSLYPRPPYNWNCMQWLPPPPPSPSGYYARSVMNIEGDERRSTLWIPKPLRIDDPDHEAAKSSIWEALGIKNERGVAIAGHTIVNGRSGIFKAFQSKNKPSLQANLASSSYRSLN